MLPGFALAASNGWLHWNVRATCKELQCDAWATTALKLKAVASTARARSQVRVILKLDSATMLADRIGQIVLPLEFLTMAYWLKLLNHSLLEYMAVARSMFLTSYGRAGTRPQDYMTQLKHSIISAADIAKRALPALLAIAGHLKLCEARMESIDADNEAEDPAYEEDLQRREDLEQILTDLDLFIAEVQEEVAPLLP